MPPERRHTQRPFAGRAASRPAAIWSSASPRAQPDARRGQRVDRRCGGRRRPGARTRSRPPMASVKRTSVGGLDRGPDRADVGGAARAEGEHARAPPAPAWRGRAASSALRTTAPSGGIARTSALFSACTPSSEPKNSVWAEATTVTTPTVGRQIARERRDLPRLIGAELERRRPVLGAEPEERQGQPPLVVEARFGLEHGAERAEHRGHHLLGRGLAVRARHRGDGQREARAVIRGEPAERPRRVLHQHHRRRARAGRRAGSRRRGRPPRARPRRRRKAWPSRS